MSEASTQHRPVSKAQAYFALEQNAARLTEELDVKRDEHEQLSVQLRERQAERAELLQRLESMRSEVTEQVAGLSELFVQDGEVASGVPNYRPLNEEELQVRTTELESVLQQQQSAIERVEQQINQLTTQIAECLGSTVEDLQSVNARLTEIGDSMDGDDHRELAERPLLQKLAELEERIQNDIQEYDRLCIGEFKDYRPHVVARCEALLAYVQNTEIDMETRIRIAESELLKMDAWAQKGEYCEFQFNPLVIESQ